MKYVPITLFLSLFCSLSFSQVKLSHVSLEIETINDDKKHYYELPSVDSIDFTIIKKASLNASRNDNHINIQLLTALLNKGENLEELIINSYDLNEFPNLIKENHQLKNIEFNYNNIDKLPEILSNLKGLERILIRNELKGLPSYLNQFKELKELYIYGNFLEFPKVVCSLPKLENLSIVNSYGSETFKTLPKEIGDLHRLKFLNITNAKIDELPQSFDHLHNLEEVVLYNTNFRSIPPQLFQLRNLRKINMDSNPLNEQQFLDDIVKLPKFVYSVSINNVKFSKPTYKHLYNFPIIWFEFEPYHLNPLYSADSSDKPIPIEANIPKEFEEEVLMDLPLKSVEERINIRQEENGIYPLTKESKQKLKQPEASLNLDSNGYISLEDISSYEIKENKYHHNMMLILNLKTSAIKKMRLLTIANQSYPLAIVINKKVIVAPNISEPITDGKVAISGILDFLDDIEEGFNTTIKVDKIESMDFKEE